MRLIFFLTFGVLHPVATPSLCSPSVRGQLSVSVYLFPFPLVFDVKRMAGGFIYDSI